MIDVSEIVNDTDVCSNFTILRQSGQFAAGGWQANPPQQIIALGAVRNTSGRELEMIPPGDRVHEMLTFRSATQMYVTNTSGTSDVLQYQDSYFRVLAVKNYSDQGVWVAIAARKEGD
jgi:hypothetical protein